MTAMDAGPEPGSRTASSADKGAAIIRGHLKTLPASPGVYRMTDADGDVLYVGKAKNLRKRVTSYANPSRLSVRIRRMVAGTAGLEIVTTRTEAEALLLEANLIKRYKPRYNILLRDDKSFPSIRVTLGHAFPRVLKHRGKRADGDEYFGPFASAGAVNRTLDVLQRAFYLRTCSDSVFAGRTRPCLLHQIKRCAAPCVGRIEPDEYARLTDQARAFLKGHSRRVQDDLARRMQEASDRQKFEDAAGYRDRIAALTSVSAHQDINLDGIAEADVIAAHQAGGQTGVQVFFFRSGGNYGNRAYFPSHARDDEAPEVLEAFIGQFYANRPPPALVLVSHRLPNQALLAEALSVHAGRRVRVTAPRRGAKRNLIRHAVRNAAEALSRRLAESASQRKLLEGLAGAMGLDGPPERIEVYDNSHISGAQAVGAMIVAGPEGLMKNAYRKFTIRDAGNRPGDDYAMMRQVLTRRFARALKEDADRSRNQWPDLVLIDGGAGHLGVGLEVFADLGIDGVAIAAIAKGPDRDAGRERIHLPGGRVLTLRSRDPVLYFLQRLRDEAHRFVIGAHRDKRSRTLTRSMLDGVPSIGPKRKKALLHHFGSARAVAQAGLADLQAVTGISRATANKIHDWFHADG